MASKKLTALVFVFAITFLLSGCGFFRYIDGSSQEEIEQYENPVLWGKVAKLERNEADQKRNIQELENDIKDVKGKLAQVQDDKKYIELKNQLDVLGKELDMDLQGAPVKGKDGAQAAAPQKQSAIGVLKSDTADLKKRVAKLEGDDPGAATKDIGKRGSLRIKVLSGKKDMTAARKMTERLSRLGYQVSRVDRASKTGFTAKTIYYAPGFLPAALQLKEQLGKDMIVKPLTWKSAFNLIILAI